VTITFGSACSGIEAASVAWDPLGWKPLWLSEIDAAPAAVLDHHYPDTPNLGDMTKIAWSIRFGDVEAPDILVGGTPCQAFSVAGARRGLADDRGMLTIKFVELADAIDEQRKRENKEPCIVTWENVPGVLHSKDNAFGAFLGLLSGEDCELQPPGGKWKNAGCVFGPKRAIAWRILNAEYFGVAQRRCRVFVVASAREGFDPCQVLFESEGVRRDSPPSRETGQDTTGSTADGFASTGAGYWRKGIGPLRARGQEGHEQLVVYGIPGNWIGRKPENGGNATEPHYDRAPCLTATDQHGVVDNLVARRLMPVECERLQSFPDLYTVANKNGKPMLDGDRYKMLGNSMNVTNMRWIGERIEKHLNEIEL
jgi:DNA (cytosine-5)-methyltransferase 1